MQGVQTAITQGALSMDLFAKKPTQSLNATMFSILGGNPRDTGTINIALLANGHLNIMNGNAYALSDQTFSFDMAHTLEVLFQTDPDTRTATYQVLLDGTLLTSGGTNTFTGLSASGYPLNLDTIYLGASGMTGSGGSQVASEVYVDNLILTDNLALVPEPTSLAGVMALGVLMLRRRRGMAVEC